MRLLYSAALAAFVLSSMVHAASTEASLSPAQNELLGVYTAWLAKANANDQVQGIEDFTNDALILGAEGPIVEGREAVRQQIGVLGSRAGFNVAFNLERVTVSADGKVGYVIGKAMITSLNAQHQRVGGRYRLLTVWRKVDGIWKCYIDAPIPMPADAKRDVRP